MRGFLKPVGGVACVGWDDGTRARAGKGGVAFATSATRVRRQGGGVGIAEVKLSKLAMDKGESTEVKQFARKMVEDHTKAGMELKQIARRRI